MSEDEYINATDLGKISSAISTLMNITPKINELIPDHEYETVMKLLKDWQIKHYEQITITLT